MIILEGIVAFPNSGSQCDVASWLTLDTSANDAIIPDEVRDGRNLASLLVWKVCADDETFMDMDTNISGVDGQRLSG